MLATASEIFVSSKKKKRVVAAEHDVSGILDIEGGDGFGIGQQAGFQSGPHTLSTPLRRRRCRCGSATKRRP
jgi:hypothetical protein